MDNGWWPAVKKTSKFLETRSTVVQDHNASPIDQEPLKERWFDKPFSVAFLVSDLSPVESTSTYLKMVFMGEFTNIA